MDNSLKNKTMNALSWSFIEALGLQGVKLIIGIILARLLLPEQFGLIGMLTIFIALGHSFLDSGFGAALIQKSNETASDICSIFYFNILMGLMVAGLLYMVAPWIAILYSQPILTKLTQALSLIVVINSFGLIQSTLLIKRIDFKSLSKITLISGFMSGIIGIYMAIVGFGVWSLVVQQLSDSFIRTLLLWYYYPWRPSLIFSFKALTEMFGFGSRLLASGLLNQIFNNIYLVVIGKLFSASDLGYFTRAQNFQEIPSQTLSDMVARVTFPVLSSIKDDPVRMKRVMKKALSMLTLVNFPMMIGLAVIARPLVVVLLTEKWIDCISYLQLLCVLGLLYPLHVINLNVLQALGRSDLFLNLEVIKKVMVVVSIAITWRWGISAMIYGMIAISISAYYLNSYYTGVLIDYRIGEQIHDLLSSLVVAVLMGLVVYMAEMLNFPNDFSLLIAQIIIGIVVYIFLCRLFRLDAFMEIWNIVLGKCDFRKTVQDSK